MKNMILGLFILGSLNTYAQNIGARKPDVVVKKATDVVEHTAYQSIYKHSYVYLDQVLRQKLMEYGCMFSIRLVSIKKEGLFNKGQFRGAFEAQCYNNDIKDINFFLEIYPYDDETSSVLEIVTKNGKSRKIINCWRYDGIKLDCSSLMNLPRSKYNFINRW